MKLFLLIAILLSTANMQAQHTQYFKHLGSDDMLTAMITDAVPELEKVSVKMSLGRTKKLWKDKNENTFYAVADIFQYQSNDGKPTSALVVFAKYYGEEKNGNYHLYDSHGQGAAIFYGIYTSEKNKGWRLLKKSNARFNKEYESYGQYGEIGDIRLVESGKHGHALELSGTGYGQGYSDQYLIYYDINSEQEVFSLVETTSNGGAVEEEEAYEYSFTTAFIKSDKDYFDLKVEYKGTHYGDSADENKVPDIVPYQETVMYSFNPATGTYHLKK